ncbi:MAG: hypothetical protein A4E32_00644 [Methanomassiliicoccales archaeon PtaU1.Bin124]|nr:MAG: hypothetical protein A4E32_00644 [Methanomassiliicoccales archaeon PtaU1.Bin124]
MFNERSLERLFQSMNSHVPSVRPSLESLLESNDPVYLGKDGRTFHVDKEELRLLSTYLDIWDWSRLKIPLLLMTDTNYEGGMWKVSGKLEVTVISRFLGREPEKENEMLIFYPHLLKIRQTFPTAVNVLYLP